MGFRWLESNVCYLVSSGENGTECIDICSLTSGQEPIKFCKFKTEFTIELHKMLHISLAHGPHTDCELHSKSKSGSLGYYAHIIAVSTLGMASIPVTTEALWHMPCPHTVLKFPGECLILFSQKAVFLGRHDTHTREQWPHRIRLSAVGDGTQSSRYNVPQ